MNHTNSRHTRHMYAIILVMLVLLLGICAAFTVKSGDSVSPAEQTLIPAEVTATAPEKLTVSGNQSLRMEAEAEDGAEHTAIFLAGSGSDCRTELHYVDVSDVRVEVDGAVYYLEDAMREERISLEQIYAYSRIDARFGSCETFTKVRNGLTFLVFRYPEYELRFTYDYDSLPDGEHRLVNELYISKNRYDVNSGDNRVVQEDWGVTFEVREVNSSSITLRCTQSGGQQLGELVIDLFFIDSAREEASLPRLDGDTDIDPYQPRTIISRDTVSEITLDWTEIYGELSPGDYLMSLRVKDAYDPADTHPVMSKFESRQSYTIAFAVSG